MSVTQLPLSAATAVFIGLVAFIAVAFEQSWLLVRHIVVMAHEGAHAIAFSLLFRGVEGIRLRPNGDGVTTSNRGGGRLGSVASAVVGYVGPSGFGLSAAKLIQTGHALAMLWVTLFLLAILLLAIRMSFGYVTVILAGALIFSIARFAPVLSQIVTAYAITWLLLLSGVRVIIDHGLKAGDAIALFALTGIPRLIWSLLWLFASPAAVAVGGRMLIMGA